MEPISIYFLKNKRDPDMYDLCTKTDKGKWTVWGSILCDMLSEAQIAQYEKGVGYPKNLCVEVSNVKILEDSQETS